MKSLNKLKAATCSGANRPLKTNKTWFIPSLAALIPSPILNKTSLSEMLLVSPKPILSIMRYFLP
jgi:hypothetical protein